MQENLNLQIPNLSSAVYPIRKNKDYMENMVTKNQLALKKYAKNPQMRIKKLSVKIKVYYKEIKFLYTYVCGYKANKSQQIILSTEDEKQIFSLICYLRQKITDMQNELNYWKGE